MNEEYSEDDLKIAHSRCKNNREALFKVPVCGCFYCLGFFAPSEIFEWIDKKQTALCPCCGIDSVVDLAACDDLTRKFLKEMNSKWFSYPLPIPQDSQTKPEINQ